MTTELRTMTNLDRELEEGEILDDDQIPSKSTTLSSNQKINKDRHINDRRDKTKWEDKASKQNSKSRSVQTKLSRYLVKKCADFFTKEEYSKFIGCLTDFICDKAVENPDFDPRIESVTRSDTYRNVIKIQCENFDTCNWLETLDFSTLLKIKVVICSESNVDRTALDLVQVDVVIPIIPGSRIRKKEEIIPIFKGTNKNSALKFDEWKIKVYEYDSTKINVTFDVTGEIAAFLRKNNTLSFGTSQVQLSVNTL